MYCEECETHVTDKAEFKCFFLENDMDCTKLKYESNFSLCLNCFNKMYSVAEFAKRMYKNLEEHQCCMCDKEINHNKEKVFVIRCCNHETLLEIYYCLDCYNEDVGLYGKNT